MFRISDNFTAFDGNKQPYTFSLEKHTETANLHAGVTDDGFSLKSVGNRFILNSPEFTSGRFEMNFRISYPYEMSPCFQIIFGYDKQSRSGNALEFTYDIGKSLSCRLVSVKNCRYAPLSDTIKRELVFDEEKYAHLVLNIENSSVECTVNGAEFKFEYSGKCGCLAIDRSSFIGELIIGDFSFISYESFEEEKIVETSKLEIPLINGGDIPYNVNFRIDKINSEFYLTASLDGGTRSRECNKNERRGQYVAEIDYMTSPYFGIANADREYIFNASDKENCFVDPNIFWDCQKLFFGDTELPIVNRYKINNLDTDSKIEFIFGYKHLSCRGYVQQEGGNEFRFSSDGEIIYIGSALNGEEHYELKSPEDKKAVSLISKDSPDYENIVNHLKANHYFSVEEAIDFTLLYRTETNPDFLTFKAEIRNVYQTQSICTVNTEASAEPYLKDYTEISVKAVFPPLSVGVYRIVFTVYYGDSEYKTISHAFEVFNSDSDLCPPLESRLPFMFTMNNEQKKLARNGFDLSNPMPSCDFGHYIACATTTPVEAESREIWKNLKIFGRKWFAWLAIRTCDDYLSPTHNKTLENADYLFHTGKNTDCDPLGCYGLFPHRMDHWEGSFFYNNPGIKEMICDFLREHSEYELSNTLSTGTLDDEAYEYLLTVYTDDLIEYLNKRCHEFVKAHNRELAEINPNVKRSIYGPFPVYSSPTLTYHSLKYFGMPNNDELCNEYFSGFAILEDYPFSCSYHTYRGPFALMTLLVNIPKLAVYPELYSGSRGGCIDGAVKYAHAPMGDYDCPPYQNSTLGFEYVYNTAYKTRDGFGIKFDALDTLTENDCDLLIVPSLANADENTIAEIRRLYNAGVNLLAVSQVDGLEDIFKVKSSVRTATAVSAEYNGHCEYVYNTEAEFIYEPNGSKTVATVNGNIPAILTTERTALLNTAMLSFGCADKSKTVPTNGAFIVGKTIRRALGDILIKLSSPVAFGRNVGITVFEDEHGNKMLLAVDYTPFDNCNRKTVEAVVEINIPDITDATAEISVKTAKKNGIVRELRFDIRPHGFAFIRLETN